MFARNPSDPLCDAASRAGVLVVAELGKIEVRQIERLRRWPAVGMIAVIAASATTPIARTTATPCCRAFII